MENICLSLSTQSSGPPHTLHPPTRLSQWRQNKNHKQPKFAQDKRSCSKCDQNMANIEKLKRSGSKTESNLNIQRKISSKFRPQRFTSLCIALQQTFWQRVTRNSSNFEQSSDLNLAIVLHWGAGLENGWKEEGHLEEMQIQEMLITNGRLEDRLHKS